MKHRFQMLDLTSVSLPLKWPVFVLAVISLFCPLWVNAQTDNGPASIDMKSIVWKSNIELDQAITREKTRIDELLSVPNLQKVDQSVYKACKLMLTYIQGYIQDNVPVEEAITRGYQQVLDEAPKDPELSNLPDHMLGTYLPGLVEMLVAIPQPEPR